MFVPNMAVDKGDIENVSPLVTALDTISPVKEKRGTETRKTQITLVCSESMLLQHASEPSLVTGFRHTHLICKGQNRLFQPKL